MHVLRKYVCVYFGKQWLSCKQVARKKLINKNKYLIDKKWDCWVILKIERTKKHVDM